MVIVFVCALLNAQRAWADPPAPPAVAPAAESPLSVLARFPITVGGDTFQIVWSPDHLRVAVSGVQVEEGSYADWVVVASVRPGDTFVKVQEIEYYASVLWLDATRLAVLSQDKLTIWSIPLGGTPTAETETSPNIVPSDDIMREAARAQCLQQARGISVVGFAREQQKIVWSDPYAHSELALGDVYMMDNDDLVLPCMSTDASLVAYMADSKLTLAAVAKPPQSSPSKPLWNGVTERQMLDAIYPGGLPNVINGKTQWILLPGTPEVGALLFYGAEGQSDIYATVSIIELEKGVLHVVDRVSIPAEGGDTYAITLEPSPIQFNDSRSLILIKNTYDTEGNVGGHGGETWHFLRLDGRFSKVILSFDQNSNHSNDESGESQTSDIKTLKTKNGSWLDVHITTTTEISSYKDDADNKTVKTEQTLRWDDASNRYQPVKK